MPSSLKHNTARLSVCCFISIACFVLAAIYPHVFITQVHAAAIWESERALGDKCDIDKRGEEALAHYRLALKALPASDLINKADLQTLVTLQLVKLKRDEQASVDLNLLVNQMRQLSGQHAATDRLLYSLTALAEELDLRSQGSPGTLAQRKKQLSMLERLYCNCLPKYVGVDRLCAESRVFLSYGDVHSAWQFMEKIAPYMHGTEQKRQEFEARLAAVKKRDGKPETYNKLFSELTAKKGLAQAAATMADAQSWAADYEGCIQTIESTRKSLKKSGNLDSAALRAMSRSLIDCSLDRGAWSLAEKECKTWLALPGASTSPDRKLVLQCLVRCLQQQSKNAEAKKYEQQVKSGISDFDFITEDENAIQKEIQSHRSKNLK